MPSPMTSETLMIFSASSESLRVRDDDDKCAHCDINFHSHFATGNWKLVIISLLKGNLL